MNEHTLLSQFRGEQGAADQILERARLCAALTKPHLLPPKHQNANDRLPENYQSLGPRGATNMEGRILLALFPPGMPWFQLHPVPELRFNPQVDQAQLAMFAQQLSVYELLGLAKLEAASMRKDGRNVIGFRTRMRQAISQIVITGDVLCQMADDYRIKVFRRDMYTTYRDDAGDVLHHLTCEKIDPLSLPEEQRVKAELDQAVYEAKRPSDRMKELVTRTQWQPETAMWLTEQEINGHIINVSEDKISPFFGVAFELVPGEHYGRGFIEMNLGDLRSINEMEEKLLDFAGMASKMLLGVDSASQLRDKDLEKPSGSIVRNARVEGGTWTDVAFLSVNKISDFRVVHENLARKSKELAAAMLLESAIQPQKERVTATQIERIAVELEGTLGGLYAPVADELQVPMLRRLLYQMRRDKIVPADVDEKLVDIVALTGLSALSRETNAQRLLSAMAALSQLGPEAVGRIDVGVATDLVMRYIGIYEPGLIKSAEKIAAETQAAIGAAIQQAAGEQAVKTIGNVAESALTATTGV